MNVKKEDYVNLELSGDTTLNEFAAMLYELGELNKVSDFLLDRFYVQNGYKFLDGGSR